MCEKCNEKRTWNAKSYLHMQKTLLPNLDIFSKIVVPATKPVEWKRLLEQC